MSTSRSTSTFSLFDPHLMNIFSPMWNNAWQGSTTAVTMTSYLLLMIFLTKRMKTFRVIYESFSKQNSHKKMTKVKVIYQGNAAEYTYSTGSPAVDFKRLITIYILLIWHPSDYHIYCPIRKKKWLGSGTAMRMTSYLLLMNYLTMRMKTS